MLWAGRMSTYCCTDTSRQYLVQRGRAHWVLNSENRSIGSRNDFSKRLLCPVHSEDGSPDWMPDESCIREMNVSGRWLNARSSRRSHSDQFHSLLVTIRDILFHVTLHLTFIFDSLQTLGCEMVMARHIDDSQFSGCQRLRQACRQFLLLDGSMYRMVAR